MMHSSRVTGDPEASAKLGVISSRISCLVQAEPGQRNLGYLGSRITNWLR